MKNSFIQSVSKLYFSKKNHCCILIWTIQLQWSSYVIRLPSISLSLAELLQLHILTVKELNILLAVFSYSTFVLYLPSFMLQCRSLHHVHDVLHPWLWRVFFIVHHFLSMILSHTVAITLSRSFSPVILTSFSCFFSFSAVYFARYQMTIGKRRGKKGKRNGWALLYTWNCSTSMWMYGFTVTLFLARVSVHIKWKMKI